MARDEFVRRRGQLFLLNFSTRVLLIFAFSSHFATAQDATNASAKFGVPDDAAVIDAVAADASILVPTRARAFAAPSGPNAIDETEMTAENGERKAFFKVGGVRDGIQKAIFDEVGNAVPPDFDHNDNMGRDFQFGTYDDNSVVDPRREIPLFIPPPYRNETEEEKAATATTKAPPTTTISQLRTRRPLVEENLNNRAPIPVRTTPSTIAISQQRIPAPFVPNAPLQPQQQQFPQQGQQQQRPQFQLQQFVPQQQQQFVPQSPQQQFIPQQPPQQQQFVPRPPQQQQFVPQQPTQQQQFVPIQQPQQQQQQQLRPQQQQFRPQQQQFRPQPPQLPPRQQQLLPPQQPPQQPQLPPQQPQLPPQPQQQQFAFVPRLQPQRPRRPLPPTLQTQAPRIARPFQPRNNFVGQPPRPEPQPQQPSQPQQPLQNAQNVRTGVCANTIFYESVSAAPFDLHLTYSHFATVVSVDQCARTCHEFNCASALFDPSTRRCQFNPATVFSVPQGTCPNWPNTIYRNNVRAGNQPLRIFCVTCQRRRRPQGSRQPVIFRTTNRNRFDQRSFSRTVSNAAAHGVVLQQPRSVDINDKRLGESFEAFDGAKVEDGVEFGDGPLSPDAMRTTIKPSAKFASEESMAGLRIPTAPLRIQQILHSRILPIPVGKGTDGSTATAEETDGSAARASDISRDSAVAAAIKAASAAAPSIDAAALEPRTSVDASTSELVQRHKRAAQPMKSSSHVVASSALSVRDAAPATKIAAVANSA